MNTWHYLVVGVCVGLTGPAAAADATAWPEALAAARTAYLKSPEAQAKRRPAIRCSSRRIAARWTAAGRPENSRSTSAGLKELRLVATLRQAAGQLQHLGRAATDRQGRFRHAAHHAEAHRRQGRLGRSCWWTRTGRSIRCGSASGSSSSACGSTPTASCVSRWTAATSGSRRWWARIATAPGGSVRFQVLSAPRRCRRCGPTWRQISRPRPPGCTRTPATTASPRGSAAATRPGWSRRSSAPR